MVSQWRDISDGTLWFFSYFDHDNHMFSYYCNFVEQNIRWLAKTKFNLVQNYALQVKKTKKIPNPVPFVQICQNLVKSCFVLIWTYHKNFNRFDLLFMEVLNFSRKFQFLRLNFYHKEFFKMAETLAFT